jgi:hypothetical protein
VTRDHVEVVRRGFEAFIGGDLEAWLALSSPNIALYPRVEEPGVRARYDGPEEMLDYLANWYSGWESYEVAPERFFDCGGYVIADVLETGVAKQTGIRIEQNFAHAFAVRDGKVAEWRMFGQVSEAMAALGISESQAAPQPGGAD